MVQVSRKLLQGSQLHFPQLHTGFSSKKPFDEQPLRKTQKGVGNISLPPQPKPSNKTTKCNKNSKIIKSQIKQIETNQTNMLIYYMPILLV